MHAFLAVRETTIQDLFLAIAIPEAREMVFRQGLRNNPKALLNPATRATIEEVLGRKISDHEIARRIEARARGIF
jgi:hypothetical protein